MTRWLDREGFHVTFASASEGRVAFEGTVATAERRVPACASPVAATGRRFGNVERSDGAGGARAEDRATSPASTT